MFLFYIHRWNDDEDEDTGDRKTNSLSKSTMDERKYDIRKI
jgi:hypothetical protein